MAMVMRLMMIIDNIVVMLDMIWGSSEDMHYTAWWTLFSRNTITVKVKIFSSTITGIAMIIVVVTYENDANKSIYKIMKISIK